jgi:phage baseplate assembly protein V
MLRFGNVTEIDATKGLARVSFDEDGIVSDWLPIAVKGSKANKHESWFDVGDFVACLMDKNIEDGVILGAIYDENNAPPVGNKDVESTTFSDGTLIKYDRSSSTLTIECVGDVNVNCVNANVTASTKVTIDSPESEFTGDVSVQGELSANGVQSSGDVSASGQVSAGGQVTALDGTPAAVHLTTHMHPTAAPGPPSPPTPGT